MEGTSSSLYSAYGALGSDSSLHAGMIPQTDGERNVNNDSVIIADITRHFRLLALNNKNYAQIKKEIFAQDHQRGVWRVCAIGTDQFVTASYDKLAKVYSISQEKELVSLKGHKREVLSLALVDQNTIATGSSDGSIKTWDLSSGQMRANISELKNFRTGIYSLIYLKSQNQFVSGSCQKPKKETYWEYALKFWDASTGKYVCSLKGHQGGISKIVELDNNRLLTSSGDTTLRIWDSAKQKLVATFTGHKSYVYSATKIDDNTVASGSKDCTVRLWNVETGTSEPISSTDQGHTSTVYDVASHGQSILASASRDGYVRVWDVRAKKRISVLDAGAGFAYAVAFTEDGKLIVGHAGKKEKPQEYGGVTIWDFANQSSLPV